MTRLKEADISLLESGLAEYDKQLRLHAGYGLAAVAAHAAGCREDEFLQKKDEVAVAVVPLTYGQGIIGGFAESVRAICSFLGFAAFVTEKSNLLGLGEAVEQQADIVFLADDDFFIALHPKTGKAVDNGAATGRGYAALLDLAAAQVKGKTALVVGAGPVGQGAAEFLQEAGAQLLVYDCEKEKAEQLCRQYPNATMAAFLEEALAGSELVVEATPAEKTLRGEQLRSEMWVAAPGVPLGIDLAGQALLQGRLFHDVLEIGVASMLAMALAES